MPLLVGTSIQTPDGVQPVWSEDVGTLSAWWTDPDGRVFPLTDISPELGYFTTKGPGGYGAVPIELVTDPIPRGGEQVRFIRAKPRRITWPLHIWGETHQQFVDRYRTILAAFARTTHRQAPGMLTIARPNGQRRRIFAFYESGMGGEAGGNQGWLSADFVLTLFCPDGYFQDTEPTRITRGSSPTTSFLAPFYTLSSGQVLGDTTIENPGEIDAWPTWKITGPMAKITAINNTLGVSFALTVNLAASQVITITTNRPTVRGPADINLTGALDWPSAVLWPLASGVNDISFQVDSAGPTTKIEMAFYARYEGA